MKSSLPRWWWQRDKDGHCCLVLTPPKQSNAYNQVNQLLFFVLDPLPVGAQINFHQQLKQFQFCEGKKIQIKE